MPNRSVNGPPKSAAGDGRDRGPRAIPPEFAGDPVVWAAWLYYEDGLNQSAVAGRLGVSRASVVNYLQEARDREIVRITLDPAALSSVRLSRSVAAAFGLESCHIVPSQGPPLERNGPSLHERIGRAGARVVMDRLDPADTLGVAWGRTVLALARALPRIDLPDVSVVQVTGSAIGTAEFSPELCTTIIANRLAARCVSLHAPAFLSRPKVRDLLLNEPALVGQFELIRNCDKIVYGVTGLGDASTVFESGYLSRDAGTDAVAQGAVGVAAGRLYDRDGRHVAGPHDGRMVGISLEEIRAVPERICVAGGPDKVEAVAAALRGGYATVLVTDEDTARGLAERGAERGPTSLRSAIRAGRGAGGTDLPP